MKKIILYACICLAIQPVLYGQSKMPESYLSHMYIVLDDDTYKHLFDSVFIKEQIGDLRTDSVVTADDSWFGKYLHGKNAYFEFFPPNGFKGASVGDIGFGFMTYTSGDIWQIKNKWQQTTADSVQTDTTNYKEGDQSYPWYYAIYLSQEDSAPPLSVWIMENTPELLKQTGFSDEEIKNKITWETYTLKKSGKLFNKFFNRITAVTLSAGPSEYDHLSKSLSGFGFRQQGNHFSNGSISITCRLQSNTAMHIETIETELLQAFPSRNIKISNSLTLKISGNKAVWIFTDK